MSKDINQIVIFQDI